MNRVQDRMLDRVSVRDAVGLILAALLSQSQVLPGTLWLPGATRDAKDDPLVACGVAGYATCLSLHVVSIQALIPRQ